MKARPEVDVPGHETIETDGPQSGTVSTGAAQLAEERTQASLVKPLWMLDMDAAGRADHKSSEDDFNPDKRAIPMKI